MTVLITGATGLIGTRLTKLLLADGHKVHYLTTRERAIKQEDNYQGFLWNLKDKSIDAGCLEGVTHIVHLVGATIAKPWTKAYRQEIFDSRIESIELLKNLLRDNKHTVTHFISASGVSIYPHSFTEQYDQASQKVDDSFLAKVVVAWEAAANSVKELDLKVTLMRTGVVFSETEGALEKIAQPIRMGMGAPLGSGKQWLSWIHHEDICGLYHFVLNNKITGTVNAVAPEPVTNKQLTKTVAKILGKSLWLPNVPSFVLTAVLGERSSLVLEGQYVKNTREDLKEFSFKFPDLELALKDLL